MSLKSYGIICGFTTRAYASYASAQQRALEIYAGAL